MNVIRYEIEKRKYSANAIQGVVTDKSGKENKSVMLCFCSMGKKEGDKKADEILNYLNTQLSKKIQ